MPSTKDIRKKIGATKTTQQITKAMKMVSAAKLRRAQKAIVSSRPYAYKIRTLIHQLAAARALSSPLLGQREVRQKLLMVVVTSDRGLCGPFNANIIRQTESFIKEHKAEYEAVDFIFIGRKGADYFKKAHLNVVEVITNLANNLKYTMANQLAEQLMEQFTRGGYDEVRLVYNEFKSAISQTVISEVLLPVSEDTPVVSGEAHLDFIFEPNDEVVLDQLLKKHFAIQVYRVMLESLASEHGARMNAMESATRNAGELIKDLTLTYNKLRQAAITKELIEIVSGAEAL